MNFIRTFKTSLSKANFNLLFCCLIGSVFALNSSNAQSVPCEPIDFYYLNIQNSANILQTCDGCIRFVHACTGEPAEMEGGKVELNCGNWDQPDCYRVDPSNFDRLCDLPECEFGSMAGINFRNWTVCGNNFQTPCEIYVAQFLPPNPMLNDQVLGNYHLLPIGFTPLNLNEPVSRTVVTPCPGEEAILTLPGLYVPEASGLCLHLNISDENGDFVAQEIFDHSDIDGESVDLTELYSNLAKGLYQLELVLKCCDPDLENCRYNSSNAYTKRVWIEVQGGLAFSATMSQGGGFSPCSLNVALSSTPPGPVYENLSIECSVFLVFYNINNPNDEQLTYAVYELDDCDPDGNETLLGQVIPILPHNWTYSVVIPPIENDSDCRCFRLDIEYESCGGFVIENYYYMVDGSSNECDTILSSDDGSNSLESIGPGKMGSVRAYPNPATAHIQFEVESPLADLPTEWQLFVFDNTGKLVKSTSLELVENSSEIIPLEELVPGKYFYHLHRENKSFNGSFIKH